MPIETRNQNNEIQFIHHIEAPHTIELPRHSHSLDLLVFVKKGFLRCHLDEGYWLVPAQSAIWISADVEHSNSYKKGTQFAYIFIAKEKAAENHTRLLSIPNWIKELLLFLADHRYPTNSDALQHQMAAVLLMGLRQAEVLDFYAPLPSQKSLKHMAEDIMRYPNQRKKLSEWAAIFNCSERTLARRIETYTGMSFSRWQQQLLVLLAIQQLSNSLSVKQISLNLGYESVSAFIALFKKHVQLTPRQFYQRFLKTPVN